VIEATKRVRRSWAAFVRPEPLGGAYFWLLVFFFVYCARPEDWIPGLAVLPMAKISGVFALLALLLSLGGARRDRQGLPREAYYLLALDLYLMVSAVFSPVWRGGAVSHTLDFSKALVAVVVTILTVTSLDRLRRLILVQTGSVIFISVVSLIKGRGQARLESVLNGMYGNPNDLAFAIALVIPFCFAFMLSTRSILQKAVWAGSMVIATTALLLTGSREGVITLAIAGVYCLWRFALKGRRPLMVMAACLAAVLLFTVAGKTLRQRFAAMSGENLASDVESSAYASYQARQYLIRVSLQAIEQHPILGLGASCFESYSGAWREVHVTFLQMAAEGGIPALILFLMIFRRGFANLTAVAREANPDPETRLFTDAVKASLLAYVVGALFAPEAYQFFPLFAVAYTSVLVAVAQQEPVGTWVPATWVAKRPWRQVSVYSETAKAKPPVLAH